MFARGECERRVAAEQSRRLDLRANGHDEPPVRGPVPDVQVERAGLLRRAAPSEPLERTRGRAVDRFAVRLHPCADASQRRRGLLGHAALRVGPDIEQQVAALRHDVGEQAHDGRRVLPVVVVRAVAVALVERVVDLPVHAGEARRRHILLGRAVVAVLVLEAEEQAVVDEDRRLRVAHVRHQLRRAPRFALPRLVGVVEPDRREVAVAGEQFANVRAHVGLVARVIARMSVLRVAGQRHLVGVRVLPIEQRVVEARLQPARTHRVRELARDVAAFRRDVGAACDVIGERIRLLRLKQREAVVMLGGHHRVAHARGLREIGPRVGKAHFRRERGLHLPRILRTRHRGPVLDPLRVVLLVALAVPEPARRRVEAEVDEHAKPRLAPPLHARVARRTPCCDLLRLGVVA